MQSTEVDVLDRLPFLFENMRTLVISVDFTKMAHILSFFCLLRSAPVIEELEVVGPNARNQTEEFKADDDFLNVQWTDNMFAKLQVVQMNQIMCFCNAMHLMEFILSKARVLQVLSVRFAPDALCVDKAIIDIKGYPRASPDAQVIFLGNESAITSSITTSSKNVQMEETQTTNSRHDSIDAPTENAEVEEPRTPPMMRGSVNSFTENVGVDGTQAVSSGLVYDVCPLRRKRLDLESVAQLEQLEEEKLKLQRQIQLELDEKKEALENRMLMQDHFIWRRNIMGSTLKSLFEPAGITLPPFPKLSSAMSYILAKSGVGDTPVSPGVGGATDDHAVSP